MKARRGSGALGTSLVVMLFFAVICATVIGLAHMDVEYYFFFERRGILEQATQAFAESLAKSIKANASTTWWPPGGSLAPGSGDYVISNEMTGGGNPIRFTYVISPDKTGGNDVYKLFVKGEGENPDEEIAWGVSVDVYADPSSADVWSKVVRIH
jgi:hypothetical protein